MNGLSREIPRHAAKNLALGIAAFALAACNKLPLFNRVIRGAELNNTLTPIVEYLESPTPEILYTPTPKKPTPFPTPEEPTPFPTPEESTPFPTPEEVAGWPEISLSVLLSGFTIPEPGDSSILEALETFFPDIDLSQVVIRDSDGNPLPYFVVPKVEVVNGEPVIQVKENHYGVVLQDIEGQNYFLPLPTEVTFVEGGAIKQALPQLVQDKEGNWKILYEDNQGGEIAQFGLENLSIIGGKISVPVIKPSTANAVEYDLPQGIGEIIEVGLKLVPWVVSEGDKGETTIFFSPEEGKILAFNLPEGIESNGLQIGKSGDKWVIYSQRKKVGEIVEVVSDQNTEKVYEVMWNETSKESTESSILKSTVADKTKVFSGPGLFYSSIDALSPDIQVNIIGRTDSAWVEIEWINDEGKVLTGWVNINSLEIDDETYDKIPIIPEDKYPPTPTPAVNETTEEMSIKDLIKTEKGEQVSIKELEKQFQWLVVYNEKTGEYERILGDQVVTVKKEKGQIIAVKNDNGEWVEALLLSRRGGSLGFEGMQAINYTDGSVSVTFTGFNTGKFSSFPDYTFPLQYINEKGEEVSKQVTAEALQILIPVEYSRVVQGNKVDYEPTVFYPLWITIDFVDEEGNFIFKKIGTHWLGENYHGVGSTLDLIYYFQLHRGIEIRIEQLNVLPVPKTFLEQFYNSPDVGVRRSVKAYESYFLDPRIQENNRQLYDCAKKAYSWRNSHLRATPEEFRKMLAERGLMCTLPPSTSPVGFLGTVGGIPNPYK